MKKILVIGLGLSGVAAAEFLLKKGEFVVGVDREKKEFLSFPGFLEKETIEPFDFDLVVLSPGIPPSNPHLMRAKESGIEVIGEAEFALRHLKNRCIGITGTNGKTTVTLLTTHVLNQSGLKARALGNVGDPLIAAVESLTKDEVVVAELSSFQLETMHSKVLDVAVILNITPDHLDRYANMQEYADAKYRIALCMKEGSPLYVRSDMKGDFFYDIATILPIDYRERGRLDVENALASWALCKEFKVTQAQFINALMSFKKPAHRIEFVDEIDGVFYYDDSKGTNIDAVIQAVKSMKGAVILIAGGVDKGSSYTPWISVFQNKVKKVVAIGQAAEKIKKDLEGFFDVIFADSLKMAVDIATSFSQKGDCVLLSPGCSSYDMFRDYKERGEKFKLYCKEKKT